MKLVSTGEIMKLVPSASTKTIMAVVFLICAANVSLDEVLSMAQVLPCDLFVSNARNSDPSVLRFDLSGQGTTILNASDGLGSPRGLAIGPCGDLFIADPAAQIIFRWNPINGLTVFADATDNIGYSEDLLFACQEAIPVIIDIMPGSDHNSINPKSKGEIPVAILSCGSFDANIIDPTTVRFGATGTNAAALKVALEDIDGDGDTDMILHFATQDTDIRCGDTTAFLRGQTFTRRPIQGYDFIVTVGCKSPKDNDSDGVPDTQEQGPKGDNPNYDGNGDGIPDWRQYNVASFTTFAEDGRHYLTIALTSGQCLSMVQAFRTIPPLPRWTSLPFGYFTFKVTGLHDGQCATVTIYLDAEAPQTFYKFGRTPENPVAHWYDFSYNGQTGAEIADSTIMVVYLCDGSRGDYDLTVNREILDPGGPAAIDPHPVSYFPHITKAGGDETELGIINQEGYYVTGMLSFYQENGEIAEEVVNFTPSPFSEVISGEKILALPGRGKMTITPEEIPSNAVSAMVVADGDLVGYGRFKSAMGQRYAAPGATLLSRRITIPYDQPDPSWNNRIFLLNAAEGAATITVSDAEGNRSETVLEAKQQQVLTLDGENNPRVIESSSNIAAVEVFTSLASGGGAASILLGSPDQTELLVPAILFGSGENTGIGLGNPSQDDLVAAFGYTADGEEEEVSLGLLPARSVMTANLSRLFSPDILWVKIAGVSALETPFGPSALPLQGLASYWEAGYGKVATVSLNGLKFREGIIGVVASGARPMLTLMNPDSTDATVTITAYTGDGTASTTEELTIPAGGTMPSLVDSLAGGSTLESGDYIQIESDRDLYGFETIYADGRMEILPILK